MEPENNVQTIAYKNNNDITANQEQDLKTVVRTRNPNFDDLAE
jgi:hypothetical protein